MYTSDCIGCTTEGAIIRLLGERNFDYMMGTPCTTNVLDLPGSQEYGSDTSFEFEDRDQLGACFQVDVDPMLRHPGKMVNNTCLQAALNARLTDGGTVTWTGTGDWSPGAISSLLTDPMICVDWMDPR